MDNIPLVSVIVVTYNSSKTIIETLDSIYSQTYQNLELIVADDCSKDETIKICNEWIEKHVSRFQKIQILTAASNVGTAANLNRAEEACSNDWVKIIAGDDLLEETCINDYINYIEKHPDAIFIFSKVSIFGNSKSKIDYFEKFFDYDFFHLSSDSQINRLIYKGNCIPAATFFYNLNKKKEMGLQWDERVPLLEDLPMWINALKRGIRLHFVDKVTARYRVGGKGITSGSGSVAFFKSKIRFDLYYVFENKYHNNPEEGMAFLVDYIDNIVLGCQKSLSYRIGKKIVCPIKYIQSLFYQILKK